MYDSTAKCKLFQRSIAWETFWDDFKVGAVWETFKVGTVWEHLLVCLGHSTLLAASRRCRQLRNPAFKRPEGKMVTLYKISHLGGFSTKDSKSLEVKLLSHSGKSLTSEDCLQQHSSHSLHFPVGGEGLQPNWEKGWKARRKLDPILIPLSRSHINEIPDFSRRKPLRWQRGLLIQEPAFTQI